MPNMLAIDPQLGIKITGNSSNNSVGVIAATTNTLVNIVIILTLTLSSDLTSTTKTPENNIIDFAAINTSIPTTLVVVIVVIVVIIVIIFTLFSASSITCTTILPISIFFIIFKITLFTTDIARMADGPGLGTNSAK
jgi:hypothetical protein